MAVYTDLTDDERDAVMAAYDLGTLNAFKGIAEGVSNSNFFLDAARVYGPQKGASPVCLHMQSHALPVSFAVKGSDLNGVPLCEESQKGWFLDSPQVQKKYFWPSIRSTSMGEVPAIVGLSVMSFQRGFRESFGGGTGI